MKSVGQAADTDGEVDDSWTTAAAESRAYGPAQMLQNPGIHDSFSTEANRSFQRDVTSQPKQVLWHRNSADSPESPAQVKGSKRESL